MSCWLLLLLVVLAWALLALAAGSAGQVRAKRCSQEAGGVSLALHVFMAAFMMLLAWLLDRGFPGWGLGGLAPWGSRSVGILHGLLVPVLLIALLRDRAVLRRLEGGARQARAAGLPQPPRIFEGPGGPKAPPDEIDGAQVLWWAWSDEPFGQCGDTAVHGFAICRYDTGEQYRFSCDSSWETVNDAPCATPEEGMADLPTNYDDARVEWVHRT